MSSHLLAQSSQQNRKDMNTSSVDLCIFTFHAEELTQLNGHSYKIFNQPSKSSFPSEILTFQSLYQHDYLEKNISKQNISFKIFVTTEKILL